MRGSDVNVQEPVARQQTHDRVRWGMKCHASWLQELWETHVTRCAALRLW